MDVRVDDTTLDGKLLQTKRVKAPTLKDVELRKFVNIRVLQSGVLFLAAQW
jgi:hypothetical protein